MEVKFRLLGDVQAWVDGRVVELGHARQRCVLAVLLVDANRPVSLDQLVERAWSGRVPQRAHGALYTYLSRLRKVLRAAGADVAIVRRPLGYVLTVDPLAVDLHRFRHLVARARTAGEVEALALLERALRLWRGEAFAALDTPWLSGVRQDLDRQRLAAELDRNDLALGRGQHAALLAGLIVSAGSHPLDERLAGQLMLASYRSGRQADALAHYERLRRWLAEELGADPGHALRQLHRQILTADPALAVPAAVPTAEC